MMRRAVVRTAMLCAQGRCRRRHALAALWWLCALWSSLGWAVPAQAQVSAAEEGVKAAYLFKFMPYVEWPAAALPAEGQPFVIAVASADAVHAELKVLCAGRQLNGHPIVARRLGSEADALDGVHVLFIGHAGNTVLWTERLKGRPVLLVTDEAAKPEAGAMLNLLQVAGRIRFEAWPAAAEHAGLKLGARLLAVAERVVTP